jgi:hypothetical protein
LIRLAKPLGVTGNQLRRQHQQQRIGQGECIVGQVLVTRLSGRDAGVSTHPRSPDWTWLPAA